MRTPARATTVRARNPPARVKGKQCTRTETAAAKVCVQRPAAPPPCQGLPPSVPGARGSPLEPRANCPPEAHLKRDGREGGFCAGSWSGRTSEGWEVTSRPCSVQSRTAVAAAAAAEGVAPSVQLTLPSLAAAGGARRPPLLTGRGHVCDDGVPPWVGSVSWGGGCVAAGATGAVAA